MLSNVIDTFVYLTSNEYNAINPIYAMLAIIPLPLCFIINTKIATAITIIAPIITFLII